uniref:transcription termination factor 4, mitochondrial-like n=1 Tax=Styela clava TaxID=7725 RepID=UPI001939922A|nr:transcription termination factor 4, mitochondrial-like [Styela clava]
MARLCFRGIKSIMSHSDHITPPLVYCGHNTVFSKKECFSNSQTKTAEVVDVTELADKIQMKMSHSYHPIPLQNIARILQTFYDLKSFGKPELAKGAAYNRDTDRNIPDNLTGSSMPMRKDTGIDRLLRHFVQIENSLIKNVQLSSDEAKSLNTSNVIDLLHGSLGFGTNVIVRFMKMHPEIFGINVQELEKRIDNLRSHGLREGFLQRSISHTPQYLTMPISKIISMINLLIHDLDFTVKELPELFLFAPQIFLDPFKDTEEKFQYIYFTMGYKKHYVLARHGILRYSLKHIKERHLFLERRGQFQLTDKNRKTTIENPNLKYMICHSDLKFCSEVALCPLDEFIIFKEMLALEDTLRKKSNAQDFSSNKDFADKLIAEMTK